ncbi:MAG TPA: carboxymuconolactone decarboxylase family protein [Bacillota bacterium]|nr:carboxymuconolactone decarboxylase family protein [Fastidiosipila sp.]HPX93563.1 carboxymuconolactone decarboxylase family protein [Bacillota bacterium]HQB80538.1 carboxymuconolactone decarboxylase family protein [Bacillota bacterium]
MDNRFYKKIYNHCDFFKSLVLAFRGVKYMRLNRRKGLVSSRFRERIMLAVTEVNGCEACSYAHTKFALEEGMSPEEIEAILSGEAGSIPQDERVGVFFAQHYTDNNWKTSEESWQRLVDEYGEEGAWVILAMIRVMNAANIYGIAISALFDRLKGKPSGKTHMLYELSIMLAVLLYLPLAAVRAVFDNLTKKPVYPF